MGKRTFLTAAAVSAAASALIGGVPAVAGAATAATAAPTAAATAGGSHPVIVMLKSGFTQGAEGTREEAASAEQALSSQLTQAGATGVKRFTLVNSLAATVSTAEQQRLAADPAVAEVIPDTTFTVQDPVASVARQAAAAAMPSTALRSTAEPRLKDIPGACAAKGKAQLAPEGLALTRTASDNTKTATARKLGFTGAGVKVGFLADGVDPANGNLRRTNGKSVFSSYQDFTGNGVNAPTTGGEAFLDANTIAGQGAVTYNVNGFSAQTYPGTCDIKIEGVAPGASLVGLDVFSGDQGDELTTTTSTLAQAINYAVKTAKVNVLNESFGGNPLPDTAQDVIKLFNDAAVKAGVTVSVSSGDAGTSSTIGSPATDPNVISVGATTQYQALAQANLGGARYFASKGWLSDNISSFSSAGFTQAGGTVNLVAPGDLSWASCDANTTRYSDCTNDLGKPSDIEEAGGTSESAPFVSGAAALVIQAYRKTHSGQTPSPAVIKRILLSTATDLGTPAQEQGAGLLNSDAAVQLAESYGKAGKAGQAIVASAGQLTDTSAPGVSKSWQVTVTNEGSKAQTVSIAGRALKPAATFHASGTVTLSDARDARYTAASGSKVNYATFKFRVPAKQGRLDASIAYPADSTTVTLPPNVVLYDPEGRIAADSEAQGLGDYGNVDVRSPAAGLWTAVVVGYPASAGGYNGKVSWSATTQDYGSFGTFSARSLRLAPGQAKSFVLSTTAPASAGDLAGAVLLHSAAGVTSVPVVVRSLIDVSAGGDFSGVLTGGNGRDAVGQNNFYQFDVPPGTKDITAKVALPTAGIIVGAYLVGPDGNTLGYGQNYTIDTAGDTTDKALAASVLNPAAGLWTLLVDFAEPTPGTATSYPFTGTVSFDAGATATAGALDSTLTAGQQTTLPVTVTNNSGAPEDFFIDPRLTAVTSLKLAPVTADLSAGSNTSGLPLKASAAQSYYFVPSHSSTISVTQASTVPAMTDLSLATGDPDVGPSGLSGRSLCGTSVYESYTPGAGTVATGGWVTGPSECGPYAKAAKSGKATDSVAVTTQAFDPAVTTEAGGTPVGDFMRAALGASAIAAFAPVEVQPGKSAVIDVEITPSGPAGSTVTGTLYVDDYATAVPAYGVPAASEVTSIGYSYAIAAPSQG